MPLFRKSAYKKTNQYFPLRKQQKAHDLSIMGLESWSPGRDSNSHGFTRRILNPLRLPFRHLGIGRNYASTLKICQESQKNNFKFFLQSLQSKPPYEYFAFLLLEFEGLAPFFPKGFLLPK